MNVYRQILKCPRLLVGHHTNKKNLLVSISILLILASGGISQEVPLSVIVVSAHDACTLSRDQYSPHRPTPALSGRISASEHPSFHSFHLQHDREALDNTSTFAFTEQGGQEPSRVTSCHLPPYRSVWQESPGAQVLLCAFFPFLSPIKLNMNVTVMGSEISSRLFLKWGTRCYSQAFQNSHMI